MPANTLAWTKRLYAEAPWKRWVVLGAALVAGAVGFLLFPHPLMPLVAIVAILASTAEFWMPLRYFLDENGASVRCGMAVTAIEWAHIKRIVVSSDGMKLSPLAEEGRTSPFRGVHLRFEGNAEQVREFVEGRAPKDVRFLEYGSDPGGNREPVALGGGEDPRPQTGDSGDPVRGDA